ncbi:MAG: hypothetical protein LAO30_26325 [Acidobacteriia bacterium]|nr:hypothetical protein [Terriglobia bacterium]
MDAQIVAGQTDDPIFIELLNSVVCGVVLRSSHEELYVVQIDNWFDHKWLRFSGIGVVPFRFPAYMKRDDGALDEFYQDKVTFPPFTPNRVVSQHRFERRGERYTEAALRTPPHGADRQPSELNLHRRVGDAASSACFVWYSSNTLKNDRASIMVYTAMNGEVESWFAAFRRNDGWSLQSTKGISREDVQSLVPKTV